MICGHRKSKLSKDSWGGGRTAAAAAAGQVGGTGTVWRQLGMNIGLRRATEHPLRCITQKATKGLFELWNLDNRTQDNTHTSAEEVEKEMWGAIERETEEEINKTDFK